MGMLDQEMPAATAAQYLQDRLRDGRSYYSWLQDMRRDKRTCRIPFHRGERGRALYYKSDLDTFIDEELAKSLVERPTYLVERDDSSLGSWLPPIKRIEVIH